MISNSAQNALCKTCCMDDREIVNSLLLRDQKVTQQYLYVQCYPLFKSVYDNYYTDCESCVEFINEIYVHLLLPNKDTGQCKLQSFQFGSTLTTWLKTVAVYYCYERYRKRQRVSICEEKFEYNDETGDRLEAAAASMYVEDSPMWEEDLETILSLMPNKRYSLLIRLRYIDNLTNEETAAELGMTMDNYYNKHRRAKLQFNQIIENETRNAIYK